MRFLAAALMLFVAVSARAASYSVAWDVGAPPTVSGVVQPYTAFQLFRCNGTFAACPTASSGLWTQTDSYDPATACPLPPPASGPACDGTTVQTGTPGVPEVASFYMVAVAGTLVSAPSNVVTVTINDSDRPISPPLNLRFTLAGADIRFVHGTIQHCRKGPCFILAKGEPAIEPNTPFVPLVDLDTRKGS